MGLEGYAIVFTIVPRMFDCDSLASAVYVGALLLAAVADSVTSDAFVLASVSPSESIVAGGGAAGRAVVAGVGAGALTGGE